MAEGARLESVFRGNSNVGSNPTLSAIIFVACMHSAPKATARAIQLPGWPHFEDEDIEAVSRILRSGKINYWTGEEGRLFEREYAAYVGTNYAIALANGTVALELALRALGVGQGDEVVTPARTFIASASCVAMVGATPVFADVDRHTQNLTAETIRPRLTSRTRAIIAVHLAGCPSDMDPILQLAREHNLKVIEDCAQAHGARYKDRPVGSLGDIGTFSFCQDKIITTGGEGGMLTLNDEAKRNFAWSFKDHGKNAASDFSHDSTGSNLRLTEMQSALGRNALRRLDTSVETRRRNAAILTVALQGISGVRVPQIPEYAYHAFYKFYVFIDSHNLKLGWNRERILQQINEAGVPCSTGGLRELYREKAFASPYEPHETLPNAHELSNTSLMFLVHPTLNVEHVEWMGSVIAGILRSATR